MKVTIEGVDYEPRRQVTATEDQLRALEVRMDYEEADDVTVRTYLCALLQRLWNEGDQFDSKRPFGDSGWQTNLMLTLAKAGHIDLGPINPNLNEPFDWTQEQANKGAAYISDLIAVVFFGVEADS